MHEYPATQEIIRIASQKAQNKQAKKVRQIKLVMGDNCGFLAESIVLYFDIIAQDTPCAGAELVIERIKPLLRCSACSHLFERRPFIFDCPRDGCSGEGEPTDIGREFRVASVILDT